MAFGEYNFARAPRLAAFSATSAAAKRIHDESLEGTGNRGAHEEFRKIASEYDHVEIAPSPIGDSIREIIAPLEVRFAEAELAEQREMVMVPQ